MVLTFSQSGGCLGPDVKKFSRLFYTYLNILRNQTKKSTTEPKSYTAMLLYLFVNTSLSTCPKKLKLKNGPKLLN